MYRLFALAVFLLTAAQSVSAGVLIEEEQRGSIAAVDFVEAMESEQTKPVLTTKTGTSIEFSFVDDSNAGQCAALVQATLVLYYKACISPQVHDMLRTSWFIDFQLRPV